MSSRTNPTAQPLLRGPTDTLARAAAARPRPFLLAVAGASARGVEARGVEAVERGGRLVLAGLALEAAGCGNVLLAPSHARRELAGPFGTAMEVLLVTPDGLVAQWTSGGTATLVVGVPGSSWQVEGRRLTVAGADGVRIVELEPESTWSVAERPGRVTARAELASGRSPFRLLATAGADLGDAEAAFGRLTRAREAQTDAHANELRSRRLSTRTGVDELDDGLAWAAARVDAASGADGERIHALAAGEAFPLDPASRGAWTALGALASGGRVTEAGGERTSASLSAPTELELLALARAASWRGAPLRPPAALPPFTSDPARGVARRAALLALADAIEPWEGKARAQALREEAATRRAAKGPLRLPTLGGGGASNPLASALDLPGRPRFAAADEDPPLGVLRALVAWACLNDGALERGFALFRRHLADGFAHGAGLWPDGGRIHDPAAAALVPLVFLDGLLGARGDAHYGRLRLAPRLPPHWSTLSVAGILLGEAEVRLDYEADARRHTFRIAQESGRMPLMLIFEPVLPVAVDAPVRIDGGDAQVDVLPAGDRAQLRVQLPLDREREITIG